LIATVQKLGEVLARSLDDVSAEHFRDDPKMVLRELHEDLIERASAADDQPVESRPPGDPEPPSSEPVDQMPH
jgi:hypothetical protein